MPKTRIIPVMDIKGGIVVHAVAGRRADYGPIVSKLTVSCDPVEVARAFRERLGLTELYVADLDAIAGAEPAFDLYRTLSVQGFRLWVDAGIRDEDRAFKVRVSGVNKVVAALETLPGPTALRDVLGTLGPDHTAFSLDLQEGKLLGNRSTWRGENGVDIAIETVKMGVRSVIVLDLAYVGADKGVGTLSVCSELDSLRVLYPSLEIITGGGICKPRQLRMVQRSGASAVLIASALHDGRIGREHIS